MKKTYINPEIEIIKIASQHQMLAGSVDAELNETPQSDDDALGREIDW